DSPPPPSAPPFPTRRSSDLATGPVFRATVAPPSGVVSLCYSFCTLPRPRGTRLAPPMPHHWQRGVLLAHRLHQGMGTSSIREKRSEEHTSELQSRENLVCRL